MAQESLVRFYDLSGPKTWSPFCWATRYALNYKGIPYSTTKLAYPAIKPTCEKLFSDMTGLEATVPIVEILGAHDDEYRVLNDSTPIARLLNQRFTEEAGFKTLAGVDAIAKHEQAIDMLGWCILRWIMNDVYENALDPHDGSREYFKRTREASVKCALEDVLELRGGGEASLIRQIKESWIALRERMKREDGNGERESSLNNLFNLPLRRS